MIIERAMPFRDDHHATATSLDTIHTDEICYRMPLSKICIYYSPGQSSSSLTAFHLGFSAAMASSQFLTKFVHSWDPGATSPSSRSAKFSRRFAVAEFCELLSLNFAMCRCVATAPAAVVATAPQGARRESIAPLAPAEAMLVDPARKPAAAAAVVNDDWICSKYFARFARRRAWRRWPWTSSVTLFCTYDGRSRGPGGPTWSVPSS
mmetsp:Transcript_26262/g.77659  ORF Transcript_26262/g.77659 Transcript_26262/m.77659 type:complete len:207 (+) Transcript_26262:66-686(+)